MPERSPREIAASALLLALTIVTTTFAGMQQSLTAAKVAALFPGGLPAGRLLDSLSASARLFAAYWRDGAAFSAALLLILGAHELGHFFAGRRYHIDVSLPFFIPAPTLIGTFGAVIRMRGPLWHRRGLLDTGIAGPIAGFVFAVPLYAWGLAHSAVLPAAQTAGGFQLGDSVITRVIQRVVIGPLPAGADVLLHPVAFAAWIGLFVTMLNLIPIGQLDGGHVVYALSPRAHPRWARAAMLGLVALGAVGWHGWWFWAVLGFLVGATRHPPTVYHEARLDPSRRLLGACAIAMFVLTFVPRPFSF